MNQIFKVVKNTLGNNVVASELAKGAKKGSKLAAVVMAALFTGTAFAAPVSIQGTATSENAVSIGTDSFATSVNGFASGKDAVATGQGFSREDFANKVQEVETLTNAKNTAQAELNNLNNDKATSKELVVALEQQIGDATQKIADAAEKIAQRDNLINQRTEKENNQTTLNQNISTAQTALDGILKQGKNIYLNFTDVLNTLNWASLDGTSQARDNLANNLKTTIETDFADLAGRYDDAKYRKQIDGYVNKQGAFTGAVYRLQKAENDYGKLSRLSQGSQDYVLSEAFMKSVYGKTGLNQDGYLTEADFSNLESALEEHLKYTNRRWKEGDDNSPLGEYFLEYERDLLFADQHYTSLESLTWDIDHTGSNIRKTVRDGNIDLFQRYLNTGLLFNNSKQNNTQTYLWSDLGLTKNFTDLFVYSFKTTSNERVPPLVRDGSLGLINKLKKQDQSSDQSATISQRDLNEFNDYYNALNHYYNIIDWNDANAVYDLNSYKAQLDNTKALADKVKVIVDNYTAIIQEKAKDNPDQALIDRLTAQNIEKRTELTDLSNYSLINDYVYVLNKDRAKQELEFSKEFTDKWIAEANRDLKLYDPNDSLVVDVTNKAKELQKALENAQKAAGNNQKEIDDLNKQINNIGLTPEEEAAEQTKKNLEDKLKEVQDKQGEIDNQITEKTQQLDELVDRLKNSSLKDLGLHSQSHGYKAFASGDNSIAMGTNSTVTANDGIAIGQNSTVTGVKSIAIGKDSVISGEKSIAIGIGHNVSGNRSTTIGDPNVVSGNDSFVAGNNNNVASNNVMVLGNNITIGTGFDKAVVLGDGSSAATANPTASMDIRGETYNFAGTNPTSTVSVGATNAERQITHVAAGRVANSSTDAINGSQLYAIIDAVNKLKTTALNPSDVSEAINNLITNKIIAGNNVYIEEETNPDTGNKTFVIHARQPEPLNILAGDNVLIRHVHSGENDPAAIISANGTTVTSGAGIKIEVTTTEGEFGATNTNYHISLSNNSTTPVPFTKEESVSAGSSNVIVKQEGENDTGGKNFVVDIAKNLDLTNKGSIKMGDVHIASDKVDVGGNVINNVADGIASTDAVNVRQLKTAKSTVEAGDKAKVTTKTNEDGSKTYVVDALTSEVKGGTNAKVTETQGDKNQSVYTVDVKGDLTEISSIANGDTKLTLGDNVVNVGGAKITNLNTPTERSDAANKDYVDNSRTTITSTDATVSIVKTVVNATTGAVNYDLSVKGVQGNLNMMTDDGTVIKHNLGDTITVTGDNKNISTVSVGGKVSVKLTDDVKVNSVTTGDVSISTVGVNAGSKKVKNVADGAVTSTSKDAINGSQLHALGETVNQNLNRLGDQVMNLGDQVIKLGDSVNYAHQRIDGLNHKVDKINKQRKAGAASALAVAGLPQAHREGQSGFVAGVGQYQGETGLAVGYTRISDNGKWSIRASATTNTHKEVGGQIGVGYFW